MIIFPLGLEHDITVHQSKKREFLCYVINIDIISYSFEICDNLTFQFLVARKKNAIVASAFSTLD